MLVAGHVQVPADDGERQSGVGWRRAIRPGTWERSSRREVAVGGRIDAGPEASVGQIRKLKGVAARRGYRIFPGHDPVAWPALTADTAGRAWGYGCGIQRHIRVFPA